MGVVEGYADDHFGFVGEFVGDGVFGAPEHEGLRSPRETGGAFAVLVFFDGGAVGAGEAVAVAEETGHEEVE